MIVAGQAILWAAFLGALTFVLSYQITAPWWHSEIGWTLMGFAFFETLILGLSVAFLIFGDFPGRAVAGLVSFAGFAAMSWWRTSVLLRAQLTRRRDKHDTEHQAR